jgi:hydrogenase expression/formation protein HypD
VRPIASPLQAAQIAREHPQRQVVLFAAGFETTMAPVASLVVEGLPPNLSILLAGRLTWPAVALLLESDTPAFDALIAPGHVSTVMGPEEWRFVPERHGIATAIAGFTPESLLAALYSVARQTLQQTPLLDNCYRRVVRDGGNPGARAVLAQAFDVVDATWRGIGTIPRSGFALREAFAAADARRRFAYDATAQRKRIGAMPPGCDCARVVLGRIKPNQCVLFGRACTPRSPVGPCMVSDEGACRIWMAAGVRANATLEA